MSTTVWHRPWWLAFLDRTNLTVTALTAGSIVYSRSVAMAYFAGCALACSLTVKVLKRAIQQPRPVHPQQYKASYGMPSTHSATITYYAVYSALAADNLPVHQSLPSWVVYAPLVIVPWSVLICVSRVWLGHHTWAQISVGSLYGAVFGLGCFAAWTNGLGVYGKHLEEFIDRTIGWR